MGGQPKMSSGPRRLQALDKALGLDNPSDATKREAAPFEGVGAIALAVRNGGRLCMYVYIYIYILVDIDR